MFRNNDKVWRNENRVREWDIAYFLFFDDRLVIWRHQQRHEQTDENQQRILEKPTKHTESINTCG